jgi:hypothetical protein
MMFDFMEDVRGLLDPSNPAYGTEETSAHPAPEANDPSLLSAPGQFISDLGRGLSEEGITALFDPVAAVDRQDAKRDLASRFTVLDPSHQGPTLPNEVTERQYNEIARQYSDIRRDRSNIRLEGGLAPDPEQFESDMMQDIGDILQTESGRALIAELDNPENGARTVLQPHLTGDRTRLDHYGAFESGDSRPGYGSPAEGGTPGIGTHTGVALNPQHDILNRKWGSNHRSDVALFHELVHARHDVRGTTDNSHVQEGDNVRGALRAGGIGAAWRAALAGASDLSLDTAEPLPRREHQAVGIGRYSGDRVTENAYRRERNAVARSGQGRPGDLLMSERDQYRGGVTYHPFFGR